MTPSLAVYEPVSEPPDAQLCRGSHGQPTDDEATDECERFHYVIVPQRVYTQK